MAGLLLRFASRVAACRIIDHRHGAEHGLMADTAIFMAQDEVFSRFVKGVCVPADVAGNQHHVDGGIGNEHSVDHIGCRHNEVYGGPFRDF